MQNKIQLVFFLAGILSKASGDLYRFVLIEELKTWAEAQSYCRETYTDLATVQSDEDRAKLKEAANAVNFQSVAWIAFYRVWQWSYQNRAISYAKWGDQEPNMPDTLEACATVNKYGRWSDTYCTKLKYFFCQTDRQDKLNEKFKYIKKSMNWRDAQTYCRTGTTDYRDLATITDDTENAYLAYKLYDDRKYDAWIGLSKNLTQWLDNTSVSWSSLKWQDGQPDNMNSTEGCVNADTDGLVADYTCLTPLPFYCRENRKIQRVRFALKSDGQLNESAVMEAIEEKIEQILLDQDLEIRSRVTWSIQPDGKIFQQQETRENTQDTATACEEVGLMKR